MVALRYDAALKTQKPRLAGRGSAIRSMARRRVEAPRTRPFPTRQENGLVPPRIPDRADRHQPDRADCARTFGTSDTLPIGGPASAGPVSEFAKLDRALRERNYQLATKARRQLRTFGYSVVPLNSPRKGGAR
jgi:hypothetical protein